MAEGASALVAEDVIPERGLKLVRRAEAHDAETKLQRT